MAKEKIHCAKCQRLVVYEAKAVQDHHVTCADCGHPTPVEAKAVAKFVRTTPRKLRLVADAVRGKTVKEALTLLRFAPKRAAGVLSGVVESAQANAENAYQMNPDNLYISNIFIDGGPTLKRFMPRAMGRAATIRKRTSHITVKVRELPSPLHIPGKKEKTGEKSSPKTAASPKKEKTTASSQAKGRKKSSSTSKQTKRKKQSEA